MGLFPCQPQSCEIVLGFVADSAEATGLKWASPSAGGMTELATGSLSGASTTISSISADFRNLQLLVKNFTPSTQAGLSGRFNSDTGTNYLNFDTSSGGTNTAYNESTFSLSSDQHTSGTNLIVADIIDYANTTTRKLVKTLSITQNNGTPTMNLNSKRCSFNSTSAISSITLIPNAGTATGTYVLYGVK